MTTSASPAAMMYRLKDGTEFPLRELTLHPSDDTARRLARVLEEFFDAAQMFRDNAKGGKTPDERKNAILFATEMRHERDLAFREFLLEYASATCGKEIILEKVLPQCGDTDMEVILRSIREGGLDWNKALYDKLLKVFGPTPSAGSEPKPIS